MSVLIIGGVLSGIVLGQFFKWFVLFPAFGFATIVALSNPLHVDSSLWGLFLALLALITSLQVGYIAGCPRYFCNETSTRGDGRRDGSAVA